MFFRNISSVVFQRLEYSFIITHQIQHQVISAFLKSFVQILCYDLTNSRHCVSFKYFPFLHQKDIAQYVRCLLDTAGNIRSSCK